MFIFTVGESNIGAIKRVDFLNIFSKKNLCIDSLLEK